MVMNTWGNQATFSQEGGDIKRYVTAYEEKYLCQVPLTVISQVRQLMTLSEFDHDSLITLVMDLDCLNAYIVSYHLLLVAHAAASALAHLLIAIRYLKDALQHFSFGTRNANNCYLFEGASQIESYRLAKEEFMLASKFYSQIPIEYFNQVGMQRFTEGLVKNQNNEIGVDAIVKIIDQHVQRLKHPLSGTNETSQAIYLKEVEMEELIVRLLEHEW